MQQSISLIDTIYNFGRPVTNEVLLQRHERDVKTEILNLSLPLIKLTKPTLHGCILH